VLHGEPVALEEAERRFERRVRGRV
jgi:hypothetical protein